MCVGGGPKVSDNGAAEARAREEARQAKIRAGMGSIDQTFSQFDDGYYNQRSKAYLDYNLPQFDQQREKAHRDLTFALARSNNLRSSLATDRYRELREQSDLQRQAIQDGAISLSNQTKADVERNRGDLVSQLNATADPEEAANGALNRASLLSAPPTFTPLQSMFQNVAAGLDKAANNKANGFQGILPPLFQDNAKPGGDGSSRVVRS